VAQIASTSSTATSPPSSQVAQSKKTDNPESVFLAMLTQASQTTDLNTGTGKSALLTSTTTNAVQSTSKLNLFSGKIKSLLDKGVSLDRISNAIATKLVALSGAKPGPGTNNKISAVATYLKQGESSGQNSQTTADHLVKKVSTLLAALKDQASSTNNSDSSSDSGNILDASQAGDTPTATADVIPVSDPTTTSNSFASSMSSSASSNTATTTTAQPDTSLLYALAALSNTPNVSQAQPAMPTTTQASASVSGSNDATTGGIPTLTDLLQSMSASGNANTAPPDTASINTPAGAVSNAALSSDSNSVATTVNTQRTTAGDTSAQTNAQLTLGQASLETALNVGTSLNAIAAGQGTSLERALIRAANVSVARDEISGVGTTNATLTALSNSLDQLLGTNADDDTDLDSSPVTPVQTATSDTSLADASLALAQSPNQSNTQTSFASALTSAKNTHNVDEIMEQVVHGLSVQNFKDNPTVHMTLNPPDLGRLTIKISVNDSTVTANVVAQSSDVQKTLLDNRSQLDQVFASAGLKLGSLNVDVSGQGLGQEADRQQAQRNSVFTSAVTDNNSTDDTSASAQATNGPSMLNSVNLSLLNQLV
jgi:flagellar hook-length control protein FliK